MTDQSRIRPPLARRSRELNNVRPCAGELPRHILFLLPTVNVAETPEHEQRLTERFNERPASSESLMPEPPHHFHVSQIQLISGVLYDAFRSLKPESCEFRLFPEFRVDFPQDHHLARSSSNGRRLFPTATRTCLLVVLWSKPVNHAANIVARCLRPVIVSCNARSLDSKKRLRNGLSPESTGKFTARLRASAHVLRQPPELRDLLVAD